LNKLVAWLLLIILTACRFVHAAATANLADFADFAAYWMDTNCPASCGCGGWDFDQSGVVDIGDLAEFGDGWLVDVSVRFSFTFEAGQYNPLPAGADRVRVAVEGPESISRELLRSDLPDLDGAGDLVFWLVPGEYTYIAQALQGSTALLTIGPIEITVISDYRLMIPLIPTFTQFDHYQTNIGGDTPNTQIIFGTEAMDRFVQYGGDAEDTQYVESGAGSDWIEQYGGCGDDGQLAEGGTDNDYIYQNGGSGNDTIKIAAGWGDDNCIQTGGTGDDTMEAISSNGNDTIYIEGGQGNDSIYVNPGVGNDIISIDSGANDDTMTYEVNPEVDMAFIDGSHDIDTLTIRQNGNSFRIENSIGEIICQNGSGGTVITVIDIELIKVLDIGGQVIFQQDVGLEDVTNTQIVFGTPVADTFIQYGGNREDFQSIDCGAGEDWLEQYGRDGDDLLIIDSGTGADTIYQDGGAGKDNIVVTTGKDNDQVTQKGGGGDDSLNCAGGDGDAILGLEGGDGSDALRCSPGFGDDIITMAAGVGDDTIIYDIWPGLDSAAIDGSNGYDTLTINEDHNYVSPYRIVDGLGQVIFQTGSGGTVITVTDIEDMTVLDKDGNVVFHN
jgi:hypothetical protein